MDWRGCDSCDLSEMADRLYSMPGKLLYTDVNFVLSDGSQVEAHKLILALASPVFEMEFYSGQWVEQDSDRVVILDDMGVFRELIAFIYKQNVDFSYLEDFQLWDLLYLANKYLIKQLQTLLEEQLKKLIKNCQPKPSLLKHLERAKETILGDQFLMTIKDEIELFAEIVLSSEEFLDMTKAEAKEILKYPNLRVTEGQVFKHAAAWCLKNNEREAGAESEFQKEFQDSIEYDSVASEDFIQNILPNSHVLEREVLKTITKQCFETKTSAMSSRYALKPFKSAITVISRNNLHKNELYLRKHSFQNFDVQIKTSFDLSLNCVNCEVTFNDNVPTQENITNARVGIIIRFSIQDENGLNDQEYPVVRKRGPNTNSIIISKYLNGQIESDLSIEVVIDARKVVPLTVMRQDLMHLDFDSKTFTKSLVTIQMNPNLSILQATELIKEKFSLRHLRLWYRKQQSTRITYSGQQEVGQLVLFNKIFERNGCNFFLEVSNEPVKHIPYFMSMIYLQEKGPESVKFVKNTVIQRPNTVDSDFVRTIKYAAEVMDEEEYDIKISRLDHFRDTGFQTRHWKNLVIGKKKRVSPLAIFIVSKKKKKEQ